MPCTPWRSTSSASMKASRIGVRFSTILSRYWLGMTIRVSTASRSLAMPSSAISILRRPSKSKGLVTTATVRMSMSRVIWASTGAAPVPVPPPMPAVTNTMSAPRTTFSSASLSSRAALSPTSGTPPAPRPCVSLLPIGTLSGDRELCSACRSVLIVMKSTCCRPDAIMRLTALLPPPPTPITLIEVRLEPRSSLSLMVIVPLPVLRAPLLYRLPAAAAAVPGQRPPACLPL